MSKGNNIVTLLWICVGVLPAATIGWASVDRYARQLTPAARESLLSVYIDPIDPCDPIYSKIPDPDPQWKLTFTDCDRSRLIYGISRLYGIVQILDKRMQEQAADITAMKGRIRTLEEAQGAKDGQENR